METTLSAAWLDSFFATFDHGILSAMHALAELGGDILTFCMRAITFLGEKGVVLLLMALVLMCFRKTRRIGVCMFGAVCCGALITNVILKDWVCRTRPYETVGSDYTVWWRFVGMPTEEGFSFPSGHVTAAMAGMAALCLAGGRKYLWAAVPTVLLMAVSRMYLMAHYPSDVLTAMVVGLFSAIVAYAITKGIYRFAKKHRDRVLCRLLLEFDIRRVLAARRHAA